MIIGKSKRELEKMRAAGQLVGKVREALREMVQPGITTMELDRAAEKMIRDAGALPTFKGYHGFPYSICASVNEQIVHGFPSNYQLKEGDIFSIDCGATLEGFVGDVRPAYQRATLVVAPLVASAGTNIKILEAMGMGKAVVSTPAGVNGLDLTPAEDFVLVRTAQEMAAAIETLLASPADRARIEAAARARVERDYSWDTIGRAQSTLYRELLG